MIVNVGYCLGIRPCSARRYALCVGAWGVDPFDNDDAADWAAEFDGADGPAGIQILEAALAEVDTNQYVEAPEGAVAVAAAQTTAWLLHPEAVHKSPYNESVVGWLRRNTVSVDPILVGAAGRALRRVRSSGSELASLWAETEDDTWDAVLDRIDSMLRQDR